MIDHEVELVRKWDVLNNAIKRMLVSQPDSMSAAAGDLNEARKEMEREISHFLRLAAFPEGRG